MIPRGRAMLGEELDLIFPEGWGFEINELIARGMVKVQPGMDLQKRMCNRCGGLDHTIIGLNSLVNPNQFFQW